MKAAAGAPEELPMAGEQQELEETVETVRLEVLVATIRREVEESLLDTPGGGDGGQAAGGGPLLPAGERADQGIVGR